MSDEVIKILDALTERLGLAIDWSSSNVLPYFQQLCNKYVRYEIATSIIWIVIGIALLFCGRYLLEKTKYYLKKCDETESDEYAMLSGICGVSAIFAIIAGILIIIMQTFDIATCITFPEKMVLKELQNIYSSYK